MDNIEVVTLENNKNYEIACEIEYNGSCYLVLCNEKNSKDICIRKKEIEDNKEYLSRITEEEFNEVVNIFLEKNSNLIENNY